MKIVHVLDSLGMGVQRLGYWDNLIICNIIQSCRLQVYFILTGKSRGVLHSEFAQLAADIY